MRAVSDLHGLWFWMSTYDPDKVFFCSSADIDKVGLSPVFRPSFAISVSGFSFSNKPPNENGLVLLKDGIYKIYVFIEGGTPKRQTYIDGSDPVLTVEFLERQSVGELSVPRSVSLDFHDGKPPLAFKMGHPDINPTSWVRLEPPQGKPKTRLANIR
jgi:hypothetical protein